MFKTQNPIIVQLVIGNEQKTIYLHQKYDFGGIYDILLDKEYQGQVQQTGMQWTINIIPQSPIKKENHEAILNALNDTIIRYD